MVDLLVSSNISRYLSFKNITRLVCVDQWKPIEIPFSRQSVFMSNDISLIEKRLLMRFMQVCVDKEKHADQLQEFANRPFVELMLAYKLTPLLQNLILDCIAFARDRNITSTMAIELVQRFATSTGVYGNTPFLVSTYGSGEIQQAFCRLSAVFGATYWLGNTIERVTFDGSKPQMRDNSNNEDSIEPSTPALTVQFDNSSIGCEYLVSGAACTPSSAVQSTIRTMLSRAILITDKSIKKIADKSMLNREVSDEVSTNEWQAKVCMLF